jgi:hypothetical protein
VLLKNILKENLIVCPKIPNTMNFWHGGNLDDYDDIISQKNGRYEYGPGLYLTNHYDTARKYSKGNRKLYLVTVQKGIDIEDVYINLNSINNFIKYFVLYNKKNEIVERLQRYIKNNTIRASIFNNILLNEKAIKSTNIQHLREFNISNKIDYQLINNAFGWGDTMMVLYNMKKIINTIIIKPKDEIPQDMLMIINK